jgi:hypothetical protein
MGNLIQSSPFTPTRSCLPRNIRTCKQIITHERKIKCKSCHIFSFFFYSARLQVEIIAKKKWTLAGGRDETQSDACVGRSPNVLSCQNKRNWTWNKSLDILASNFLFSFSFLKRNSCKRDEENACYLPNTQC